MEQRLTHRVGRNLRGAWPTGIVAFGLQLGPNGGALLNRFGLLLVSFNPCYLSHKELLCLNLLHCTFGRLGGLASAKGIPISFNKSSARTNEEALDLLKLMGMPFAEAKPPKTTESAVKQVQAE